MTCSEPTELLPGGPNAIGRMLGLLGDEWNLLIIQQALMGATRYGHFIDRLPISNSVLTTRLRMLAGEGVLSRCGSEYLTTVRSRSLWPVLVSIWDWERSWVAEHRQRLPAMRHQTCGKLFAPQLCCAACGAAMNREDVDLDPGPSGQWSRFAPATATRRRSEPAATTRQAGLFPESMTVLGNRWAAAILFAAFLRTRRFTDFQNQLRAPPSVLTERLQKFCAIGVFSTAPVRNGGSERAAYLLTDKGRAFGSVLITALQWAQRWFVAPEGPAIVLHHRTCGTALTAELGCDRCRGRLSGADVSLAAAAGTPAGFLPSP